MKKYTKLQELLAEALDRDPEDQIVTDAIEATALWFECVLDEMGIMPSAIPSLLRWQYYHTEYQQQLEEMK